MKRLLAIVAAYMAGAFVGSYGMVIIFHSFVEDLGEFLFDFLGSPTLALLGVVLAAPVAIPVIAITEYCTWDSPKLIAGVGLVLGCALAFMFIEEPVFSFRMFKATSATAVAVTLGALTYWFVAWRLLPPAHQSNRVSLEQS